MSQYGFKHIAKLYKNNSSNSIKQFLRDFLLRKLQKLKKNEALPPEEELNNDVIFTKSNKEENFSSLLLLQIYLDRLCLTFIAITFSCRCIRQKL